MQICACPVYVYTVQHSVLLRRPPWGATPLFFFFFFFFWKKDEVSYEFCSGKYAETGNLDLEYFNKPEMDNFD